MTPKNILFIAALLSFAQSCSPIFYKKHKKFNQLYVEQKYDQAEKILIKDKKSSKGKDKWIYFLNRGVIAHLLGRYEESNIYFEEAYIMHEDFITKPLEEVLAFVINPTLSEYKGEDHEALMLHYYKALNYLLANNYTSALVECRRLNIKLNLLADRYEDADRYSRDAFIHTLMGIIYQANKEYNNAFIAYRNALDIYQTDYKELFGFSIPKQLKKDIIFCAHMTGLHDQVEYFKEILSMQNYDPTKDSSLCDAVVLWNNGLGPIKDAWEISFIAIPGVAGGVIFQNEDLGLCFPFPLSGDGDTNSILEMQFIKVAFPKYVERPLDYHRANIVFSNNTTQQLDLVQDINAISFLVLKERMFWELSKSLMRVALKKLIEYQLGKAHPVLGMAGGIFNFVTEQADTRNWQTLPHSLYYTRIKMTKGTAKFTFKAYSERHDLEYEKPIKCDFNPNITRFIVVNTA